MSDITFTTRELRAPREPSCDECTKHVEIMRDEENRYVALWYPQMGGYIGRAVVALPLEPATDVCFDVYVWHDGAFPFSDDSEPGDDPGRRRASPVRLHHCLTEQFINFGTTVAALMGGTTP